MSYQEKRAIVSIVTGIFILAAYCIHVYGKYQSGVIASDDLKPWAATMLVFIGIGVIATIIIQIVFHILLSIAIAAQQKLQNANCDDKEIGVRIESEMVVDEMDRLIELKSERIGFGVAGVGFVIALVSLVLNFPLAIMINIVFASFSLASLVEGFTQLYFYKRGIRNA